jgi:hypothetical protein
MLTERTGPGNHTWTPETPPTPGGPWIPDGSEYEPKVKRQDQAPWKHPSNGWNAHNMPKNLIVEEWEKLIYISNIREGGSERQKTLRRMYLTTIMNIPCFRKWHFEPDRMTCDEAEWQKVRNVLGKIVRRPDAKPEHKPVENPGGVSERTASDMSAMSSDKLTSPNTDYNPLVRKRDPPPEKKPSNGLTAEDMPRNLTLEEWKELILISNIVPNGGTERERSLRLIYEMIMKMPCIRKWHYAPDLVTCEEPDWQEIRRILGQITAIAEPPPQKPCVPPPALGTHEYFEMRQEDWKMLKYASEIKEHKKNTKEEKDLVQIYKWIWRYRPCMHKFKDGKDAIVTCNEQELAKTAWELSCFFRGKDPKEFRKPWMAVAFDPPPVQIWPPGIHDNYPLRPCI